MLETNRLSYSSIIRGVQSRDQGEFANPLFENNDAEDDNLVSNDDLVLDDDVGLECDEDEDGCSTILLSKEEKVRLRRPWRNALIIKLFDKRLS